MLLDGLQSFTERTSGAGTTPRLAEGERRHVAALFLDLKDFTSLSESMDHEALHSLVGGVMKVLAGVVDMYGGYVDKIEGDRIMALFGARLAAENDSIRAVSCAMAMLRIISGAGEYLKGHGIDISARAGIACGTVTVAPDALGHLTAMGDTINLASRLEALADEGTVLVSGRACRECGDFFSWEDRGERIIRGRTSPVETRVPLGPGPVQQERWQSSRNVARAPLTGRSRELEMLDELFRQQELNLTGANRLGGSRHILVNVTGPAGIGKTRLVEELLEWRNKDGLLLLRGFARSFAQPPFDVWLSLLRNLTGIEQGDPDAVYLLRQRLEQIASSIGDPETGQALRGSFDGLSNLLHLEERHQHGSRNGDADHHLEMMVALRNLVRALASAGRLVILLENMQSCDSASLETLSFILSNCHLKAPLLVISLQRPTDTDALPPVREDYCLRHTLELQPLSDMDCKGIMRSMTGSDLPDTAVEWLSERSGGNPFYLIELIRFLADSGRLTKNDGSWVLSEPVEEAVPRSLSGLISSRIDRMDPALRRVMQYCSVLGEEFTQAHYHAYQIRTGIPGTVDDNLQGLVLGGFLERSGGETGTLYSFCNPLFCKSAYDTLLHFNRRTLHRLAAESAIEALGDQSFGAAPGIACHFQAAGLFSRGVEWGIKAMDLYMTAFRNDEVLHWAERLLEWACHLEEEKKDVVLLEILRRQETTLSTMGSTLRRKEVLDELVRLSEKECCASSRPWVQKELGGYHYLSGSPGRAVSHYSRALRGARDLGDLDLQADILCRLGEISSAQGDTAKAEDHYLKSLETARKARNPSREASALIYMGTLSLNRGKAREALELYRQGADIAEKENRREMRMNVLANIGMTLSILEECSEALECFEKALTESREMGNRIAEGAILGNMGILHQNLGNMDTALNCFETSLEIARETGNRKGEGIVLGNLGILHNNQGRLIKARECYSRSLELRREAGNRRGQAAALLNMGSLDLELGSVRSARDCFRNALEIARETESPADEAVALGNLALVHLKEGRLDQAEEHASASIAISQETRARKNLVSSLHTMGLVLMEKKDNQGAVDFLKRALDISRDIGHRQKECLALSALGWLDLCEDRTEEALEKYGDARRIIDDLELGTKDMEFFTRLRDGLLLRSGEFPGSDMPKHWS